MNSYCAPRRWWKAGGPTLADSTGITSWLRHRRAGLWCAAVAWLTLFSAPLAGAASVPPPAIQWSANVGQPIYAGVRVHAGTVFVTTAQARGPNVFALREGKVLWRFASLGMISMPPTPTLGWVFVASDIGSTHFLRGLNTATGKLNWTYARHKAPQCMCSHATHFEHGLLLAQTDGHSLYAFRPIGRAGGKRVWQFHGDGARLTTPLVTQGKVIFGSGDHNVYALSAKTGQTLWTAHTGYAFEATPVQVKGLVIIGNRGGTLHAFNINTGKPVWAFSANGPIDTRVVRHMGMVYFAAKTGDRNIYALSAATGTELWQHPLADYTRFAPVIDQALMLVLVASRDGHLQALNAMTGATVWIRKLGGTPFSRPLIWRGHAVLKVGDHTIAAYALQTGRPVWAYHSDAVVTTPSASTSLIYVADSAGRVVALK